MNNTPTAESVKFAVGRFWTLIFAGFVFAMTILTLFHFGPRVEAKYWPVVGNAKVVDFKKEPDGSIWFRYTFTKYRDCFLDRVNWYFFKPDPITGNYRIAYAPVARADGLYPPSRPLGENISVWWRLPANEPLDGFYFTVNTYQCLFPWNSESKLGPFDLSKGVVTDASERPVYLPQTFPTLPKFAADFKETREHPVDRGYARRVEP